jgi:SAM-dependent methyltransferase
MNRLGREREHFDQRALKQGVSWWGHQTRAGQLRLRRRAELCRRVTNGNVKVLELGCGGGEFTQYLASVLPKPLIGIDVSHQLIKLAKDKVMSKDVHLVVASAENLPFRDGSFDVVIGNSVLHHLHLESAFSQIISVLKSKGRILFSEPNMLNPHVALEKNVRWIGRILGNSPDETAFFRWSIKKQLEEYGFSISVKNYDFLYPATPEPFVSIVHAIGSVLEMTPVIREISGSLLIQGQLKA